MGGLLRRYTSFSDIRMQAIVPASSRWRRTSGGASYFRIFAVSLYSGESGAPRLTFLRRGLTHVEMELLIFHLFFGAALFKSAIFWQALSNFQMPLGLFFGYKSVLS